MQTLFNSVRRRVPTRAEREDVANYGCAGGSVGSLIYYTDTVRFYNRHKDAIWQLIYEDAEQAGETPLQFVASLGGAMQVEDVTTFENLLAWYACETVCVRLLED
jgi:hypothetical protein